MSRPPTEPHYRVMLMHGRPGESHAMIGVVELTSTELERFAEDGQGTLSFLWNEYV